METPIRIPKQFDSRYQAQAYTRGYRHGDATRQMCPGQSPDWLKDASKIGRPKDPLFIMPKAFNKTLTQLWAAFEAGELAGLGLTSQLKRGRR